tara:strand:+ start:160 stop:327 length:168 start_codon:yes stop_codon:yes gene_type:complete
MIDRELRELIDKRIKMYGVTVCPPYNDPPEPRRFKSSISNIGQKSITLKNNGWKK